MEYRSTLQYYIYFNITVIIIIIITTRQLYFPILFICPFTQVTCRPNDLLHPLSHTPKYLSHCVYVCVVCECCVYEYESTLNHCQLVVFPKQTFFSLIVCRGCRIRIFFSPSFVLLNRLPNQMGNCPHTHSFTLLYFNIRC